MLAAGTAAAVWTGSAQAVDVGVPAVKLIVVDKGANGAKAVFVAKDGAISKGAGTSTATIAVTLDIAYDNGTDAATAGQFTAPEGSANWLVNKASVGKYVNKGAPTGGGTKVTVIKPGNLVKLVGKNLGDTPINILAQGGDPTGTARTDFRITDSGTGFDTSFCSTFSGCAWKSIAGGTGAKLVCKPGVADGTCGGPAPPPVVLQGALTPTNGVFNYNATLGIPGSDDACNDNFPGTHTCTFTELEAAEAAGDLDGLQDTAAATVTSFWAIDPTHADTTQCNDSMGSTDDWEYATAHTGHGGEVTALNNGAGTLGPVTGGLICFQSHWVGCCL
jgi:hypothetical protein